MRNKAFVKFFFCVFEVSCLQLLIPEALLECLLFKK